MCDCPFGRSTARVKPFYVSRFILAVGTAPTREPHLLLMEFYDFAQSAPAALRLEATSRVASSRCGLVASRMHHARKRVVMHTWLHIKVRSSFLRTICFAVRPRKVVLRVLCTLARRIYSDNRPLGAYRCGLAASRAKSSFNVTGRGRVLTFYPLGRRRVGGG